MEKEHMYLIKPKNGHREFTYLAIDYTDEQIEEMLKNGWCLKNEEDWGLLVSGDADGKKWYIHDDGSLYSEDEYTLTIEEATQKKSDEIYGEYISTLTADTEYNGYSLSKTNDNIAKFMQAYAVAKIDGSNEFNCKQDGEKLMATFTADDFDMILKQASMEQKEAYAHYKERMGNLAKAETLDAISKC